MLTVLCVFGTRPEAIKMAPVIQELARYPDEVRCRVCVTGQHRQMLDQVLDLFQVRPDYDLQVMQERQTLAQVTTRIFTSLEPVLNEVEPDWVLVQGDTTTTMAASLLAFYHHITVGHVEAGLRTYKKYAPFPEEINRRIAGILTDLHFAPTPTARLALLNEGVPEEIVYVTGNTVVDALQWVSKHIPDQPAGIAEELQESLRGKRLLLVTGHRRESFGKGMEQLCLALREVAERYPDVSIVYPVHLNPHVQEPVYRILGKTRRVHLIDPLPYASFVWLMNQAYLIVTDSGGVQEEAPALGKPVLVTREVTERAEGVESGNARLVGSNHHQIVHHIEDLLTNIDHYQKMAQAHNPYGDGQAATRIVQLLLRRIESRDAD